MDGLHILVRNSGQLSQLSRHASSISGINTHTATVFLAYIWYTLPKRNSNSIP